MVMIISLSLLEFYTTYHRLVHTLFSLKDPTYSWRVSKLSQNTHHFLPESRFSHFFVGGVLRDSRIQRGKQFRWWLWLLLSHSFYLFSLYHVNFFESQISMVGCPLFDLRKNRDPIISSQIFVLEIPNWAEHNAPWFHHSNQRFSAKFGAESQQLVLHFVDFMLSLFSHFNPIFQTIHCGI